MRKYFFGLSILICFFGCLFLFTAGGGSSSSGGGGSSSGGGKKPTPSQKPPVMRYVQFNFDNYDDTWMDKRGNKITGYRCAGVTNPLWAACTDQIYKRRYLAVNIQPLRTLTLAKQYMYKDIYSRCDPSGCFRDVEVPYGEYFEVYCFYHEAHPCGTTSFHECDRWYKKVLFYSGSGCSCYGSCVYQIIVDGEHPDGFNKPC